MTLHRWIAVFFTQIARPYVPAVMETGPDGLTIKVPNYQITYREPIVKRLSKPTITVTPISTVRGKEENNYHCGSSPLADVTATTIHYTTGGGIFNLFLQRNLHALNGENVSAGEWRVTPPILGSDIIQAVRAKYEV